MDDRPFTSIKIWLCTWKQPLVSGVLALSSQVGHIVPQCLGNSNTHWDAFNMTLNAGLSQRQTSVAGAASTFTIIHVFVIPLQHSISAFTSFAKLERGKTECSLSDHQFSLWAQWFILWSLKQLKTESFVCHSLPRGTCSFRLNHIL